MKQATLRVLEQSIIEVLEARQLMSAATLAAGVLTVQGQANQNNNLSVNYNARKNEYLVVANGVKQTFDAGQVQQLTVIGGSLNDQITVGTGVRLGAEVNGGAGNDTITGGSGADTLNGDDGNDVIFGRGGNDVLNGGTGNNKLWGGVGNDTLVGGVGNDILWGGAGVNSLNGGGGKDIFHAGGRGSTISSAPVVGSAPVGTTPPAVTPPPVSSTPVTPPTTFPTYPTSLPTAPSVPVGDVAPTVNIINPIQGQSSAGPAYFEIRANASDTSGSIKEVDFYNGDTLLGSVTAAPYSIAWTDVAPGAYTLRAVAIDKNGGGALSSAVDVTVVAPAVGNTIYVSTTGTGSGSGSENSPLSSIQAAINQAQPGDTVMIEPGTYRESLVFNNSGTATAPITIQAQQTGTVIIDGADALSGFTRDAGSNPVYTTAWDHDFFFSGTTRYHGGPTTDGITTAIGYAEQFIFNGQSLTQVLAPSSMSAGTFCVNYTSHTVSVWLPGGVSPASGQMLGSTRSTLAAPASATTGQYITLDGLTFQHAANFAQEQAVRTGNGWFMEDCVVQDVNGGGVGVQGANVVLLRVTGQNNGQLGIGGKLSEDALLIDCVSQGNNTKGFSPAWEAGSGKFTDTDGTYVQNFTAKDNNGFGLWFDYENTNYVVEGGTFTGNHYAPASWEGVGIMLEISDGPGRVENANIYGNSGSGLMVGESQNITIQNNTFTGNDLELRDLTRPPCHIYNVAIQDNLFTDTRICTTQGTWTAASVAVKQIAINGNTYDGPAGSSLMYWGTFGSLTNLAAIQSDLDLELAGAVG